MNMQQMIQAMNKVQRQYEKERAVLEEKEYSYTANGVVKLTLKGNMELVSLEILDDDIVNKDDKDMLIDMITLAYNNIREQILKEDDELTAKYQNQTNIGRMF